MKKKLILISAIVLLVTGVLCVYSGFDMLLNYTEPVTARLVSSESYKVREYDDEEISYTTKYRCVWEYEYGGKTYTKEDTSSNRPGSTAALLINPDDPSSPTDKGSSGVSFFIGVVMVVSGALLIMVYRGPREPRTEKSQG